MTTWKTPVGWIEVRDALTTGPFDHEDRVTPHTRPPADDDADHMLVRTVVCLEGQVEVDLVCEPAFDYGVDRRGVDDRRREPPLADTVGTNGPLRLVSDIALGVEGGRVRGRHVLQAGERAFCALARGPRTWPSRRTSTMPRRASPPRGASGATGSAARRIPDHRWRDPLQRSALTIKGLTDMPDRRRRSPR